MIISKENSQIMLEELKTVIGYEINIMEKDGVIYASTDRERIGCVHEAARELIQKGLQKLAVEYDDEHRGVKTGINLPIVVDGQIEGVIGITGSPSEVSGYGAVIKKMAEIMIRDIRRSEENSNSERARMSFAEGWLGFRACDLSPLAKNAQTLNIDIKCARLVAVLDCRDSEGNAPDELGLIKAVRRLSEQFDDPNEALCIAKQGRLVLIIRDGGDSENLRRVKKAASAVESCLSCNVYAGISLVQSEAIAPNACYEQALLTAKSARSSGHGRILCYNERNPEFIVSSIPELVRNNLKKQLFSGCSMDERRMIIDTLRSYFSSGGNIEAAADAGFVHKNTIYYRISQIEKLTGCSIKRPDDMFLLYVAAQGEIGE